MSMERLGGESAFLTEEVREVNKGVYERLEGLVPEGGAARFEHVFEGYYSRSVTGLFFVVRRNGGASLIIELPGRSEERHYNSDGEFSLTIESSLPTPPGLWKELNRVINKEVLGVPEAESSGF